ncbi:MAG: hypothetical protein WCI84_01020 [Bacteroidota bacterium]
MTKKVTKFFLYSFLSVLLFAGGLGLFMQTPMFRSMVRSTLYTFLAKEINAEIYIGEINGNIVNGFTVDTVMMYVDRAPFLESGKISVRFRLLDIIGNKITIDSATLENPSITLTRRKNGEWNVNRLVKNPRPADTTESTLIVTAGRVRIINARFHLIDSTGEFDRQIVDRNGKPSINYRNIVLEKIDIDLHGMYSEQKLDVTVAHCSFVSPKEKFVLKQFSADLYRTAKRSTIKNLVISTPDSYIKSSISMDNLDALTISTMEDLRRGHLSLSVSPSHILSRDMQVFLPSLDFM